jgi:hypothetical protein
VYISGVTTVGLETVGGTREGAGEPLPRMTDSAC